MGFKSQCFIMEEKVRKPEFILKRNKKIKRKGQLSLCQFTSFINLQIFFNFLILKCFYLAFFFCTLPPPYPSTPSFSLLFLLPFLLRVFHCILRPFLSKFLLFFISEFSACSFPTLDQFNLLSFLVLRKLSRVRCKLIVHIYTFLTSAAVCVALGSS